MTKQIKIIYIYILTITKSIEKKLRNVTKRSNIFFYKIIC